MQATTARHALIDATLALLAAGAAFALLLPPLVQHSALSTGRLVGASLVIALALPLHWVFLGIAARRMHRSVAGWVGLSVLLFPVGSAAALILLGGLLAEQDGRQAVAR